jgi:phospholipid-binding lipoprotein MlaA
LLLAMAASPLPAIAGEATDSTDAAAAEEAEVDPLFEDESFTGPEVPDFLEPVNRPVFTANMAVDSAVMDPIARAYGWITPDPVKQGIRGVFSNLNRPVVFVNEVLQLAPRRAAKTLGRFVLNSTLGIGGLFDPAAELGWYEHEADFGQTLGKAGIGPGFYLVWPLLGPSTVRDTIGSAVDLFLRIDAWLLPFSSQLILGGGYGITLREDRRDELEQLRRSSIDFYAAVRSAYLQDRERLVREARARPIFRH